MDLGDDVSGHCLSHPAKLGLRLDVPAAQGERCRSQAGPATRHLLRLDTASHLPRCYPEVGQAPHFLTGCLAKNKVEKVTGGFAAWRVGKDGGVKNQLIDGKTQSTLFVF